MIKVTQRAIIDQSFIDLERQVYTEFLRREKASADMYPAGAKQYLTARGPAHARVLSVLRTNHSDNRSGAEYEITRLRALEYTKFTAVNHEGKNYLVGITKPIETHEGSRHYYLGSYAVYLGAEDLVNNQEGKFHFIPTKCPTSVTRHFHHTASGRWVRSDNKGRHPLDMEAKTCWGTFGPTVNSLVSICDLPELFRTIYIYLGRYNPGSPLIRADDMDFDITTPPEAV